MKLLDIDTILPSEERLERLRSKMARSRKAVKRGVKLLDTKFLLPPGPNLLVAHTGKGKTNCFANQVHHSLKTTKGLIICVLNEETEDDFYARIACIRLSLPFNDYKLGELSDMSLQSVYDEIKRLLDRIVVIDQEQYNLNCVEDVLTIVKNNCYREDVSIILIDYLQNINESSSPDYAGEPSFLLSKLFGTQLKEFGKTAICPILISAQINPGEGDVVSRVQNDKTFGNHAKTIIELATDFEHQQTDMIVQKDRFNSCTGKIFVFRYKLGLLSFVSEKNSYEGNEETILGGIGG